jgi:hypothetical protein
MRSFTRRLCLAAALLSIGCSVPTGGGPVRALDLASGEICRLSEVKLLDQEGAGKLFQVGEHLVVVMEGTPEE